MNCSNCHAPLARGAKFCPNCGTPQARPTAAAALDFWTFIVERTRQFIGREWVFRKIGAWLKAPDPSRCLLLTGGPGSGKSAIAARLVQLSQGAVSPPRGVTELGGDWLGAFHFCSARSGGWIDPVAFAQSLALQLSRYPEFAQALAESSGQSQVHLEVSQVAGHLAGTMTGIVIQSLDVSGMSAEDAFNRVVRAPLEAVYKTGTGRQIIILVDGLDEATVYTGKVSIVDLLAQARDLPGGVRFLMTSRKDTRLEAKFQDAAGLDLSGEDSHDDTQTDIHGYLDKRLREDKGLSAQTAGWQRGRREQLIEAIAARAAGNFQYVTFLMDSMAHGQRSLTELEELPAGLDELYYDSMERVVTATRRDWQNDLAPLVGVLSTTREPLTLGQLQAFTAQTEQQAWSALGAVRQLVQETKSEPPAAPEEPRYRLDHHSMVDFFRQRTLQDTGLPNPYYLPAGEGHRRIVAAYRGAAGSWADVDWTKADDYGLRYLPSHLTALQAEGRDQAELFGLVCRPYMQAKRQRFGSHRSFAQDVELAIHAARTEPLPQLAELVRDCLLYATLGESATMVPAEALGTLARMGRVQEALDFAALIQDPRRASQAYRLIADAQWQAGDHTQAQENLGRALRAAESIQEETARASALVALAGSLVGAGLDDRVLAYAPGLDAEAEAEAWAALVPGMVERGDVARVLEEAHSLIDERAKAVLLSGLIRACARFERSQELAQLEPEVRALADLPARVSALGALSVACARLGQSAGAAQQAKDALEIVRGLEGEAAKAAALAGLLPALGQTAQMEGARETIGTLQDATAKAAALEPYARWWAGRGQAAYALEVVELIQDSNGKRLAQARLARILAVQGDKQRALELARQVWAREGELKEDRWRAAVFGVLAQAFALAGELDLARTTADAIVPGSGFDLARTARGLAKTFGADQRNYWLVQMHRLYQQVFQGYAQARALTVVAQALAEAGRTIEAQEALQRIKSPRRRAEAFSQVAAALLDTGDRERAAQFVRPALAQSLSVPYEAGKQMALAALAAAAERLELKQADAPRSVVIRAQGQWERRRTQSEQKKMLRQPMELEQAHEAAEASHGRALSQEQLALVGSAVMGVAAIVVGALAGSGDAVGRGAGLLIDSFAAHQRMQDLWTVDAFCELGALLGEADSVGEGQVRAALMMDTADVFGRDVNEAKQERLAFEAAGLGDRRVETLILALTGQFDRALAVADGIKEPEAKAGAYLGIARALALASRKPEAASAVLGLVVLIDQILITLPDGEIKTSLRRGVGKVLASLSKRSQTKIAAGQAWERTAKVRQAAARLGGQAWGAGVQLGRRLGEEAAERGLVQPQPNEQQPVAAEPEAEQPPVTSEPEAEQPPLSPPEAAEETDPQLLEELRIEKGMQAEELAILGDAQRALEVAQEALQEIDAIQDRAARGEVLGGIAQVLAQAGDKTQALELARRTLDCAAELPAPDAAIALLRRAAATFLQLGHKQQTAEICRQLLDRADAVQDPAARAAVLADVAQLQTGAGQPEQAQQSLGLAFDAARLAGRAAVFNVLVQAAPLFVASDRADLPASVQAAVENVDAWWS